MQSLETVVEAVKLGDLTFLHQFDADVQKETLPVDIQWSLTYDGNCLKANWDIQVLLTGGYVTFIVCDLTQDTQDIAYCMDLRNTDITVAKQGDYTGWLNVTFHPAQPVQVKATIFGYVNAPEYKTSQVFKFEKTINIK